LPLNLGYDLSGGVSALEKEMRVSNGGGGERLNAADPRETEASVFDEA
jgi:hypothetical protein